MSRFLLLLAMLLVSHSISAKEKPVDEQIEVDGKKPFTVKADKSYFLYRTNAAGYGPSFMRIPGPPEIEAFYQAKAEAFERDKADLVANRNKILAKKAAAAKSGAKFEQEVPPEPSLENYAFVYDAIQNLQALNHGKAIEKGKDQRVMLIEVTPGDYVLYGVGYGNVVTTCFCLGTVGFSAKAGEIVDLGTILIASASEKSDIPELAGETGFGPSMNGHLVAFTGALRPASGAMALPALLKGNQAVPATFRAVGSFVSPGVFNINRLAPVEGVLRYEEGRVFDAKSGQAVPDNY